MSTIDSFLRPDIHICQPKKGFRFSVDSVILAWFATSKKNENIIDIGAGSGVLSILLSKIKNVSNITSVELQNEMFVCLKESIRLSGLEENITPVHMDIKKYRPEGQFNMAVCNPPYRPRGIGKPSGDDVNTAARFTDSMSLADVLAWCRSYLYFGGRLAFCGDADRMAVAVSECRDYGFVPKRLLFFHPDSGKNAKVFFMECVSGGGEELKIEPPVIQGSSRYTKILQGMWTKI